MIPEKIPANIEVYCIHGGRSNRIKRNKTNTFRTRSAWDLVGKCRSQHKMGGNMLKTERQKIILDLLQKEQNVKVRDLKVRFEVSDETVRRDLNELEKQVFLRCVHGGAVYNSPMTHEYTVDQRVKQNQQEKEAICRKAADLVEDGSSIAVAASTTTLFLGNYLALKNNLTVITNSVYLANTIAGNAKNRVKLVGGDLWAKDQKVMGADAEAGFRNYCVDIAFFSVSGVSPELGIFEFTEIERDLTRAVIRSAGNRVLLNDITKYGSKAFCKITGIEDIDAIVTDWHVSNEMAAPYENLGIQVYRANL